MENILFEYCQHTGPSNLNTAIITLYYAILDAAIVNAAPNVLTIRIRMGDVLCAEFERTHDLPALGRSIACYESVLGHQDSPIACRHHAQLGLAFPLFHRFKAVSTHDNCKRAVKILEEVSIHISTSDPLTQARVLVYQTLIKAAMMARLVMPLPVKDMRHMSTRLKSLPEALLPRSLLLLRLVAQAPLSFALCVKTSDRLFFDQGLAAAGRASRLCAEEAEVLYHTILLELFDLHLMAQRYYWDPTGIHLQAAIEIANRMKSTRYANILTRCLSLSYWARVTLRLGMQREDLDDIEQTVETYKESVAMCPKTHILKLQLVNNLAGTLGQYFDHSGRVSVLDDLIALHHVYPNYVMEAAFFASNIAAAMIMRAQIADLGTARRPLDQAVGICQARKQTPVCNNNWKERGAIDLQLIQVSRVQLRLGFQTFMDMDNMLQLALSGLRADLEPGARIGFILAQVDALVAQARDCNIDSPLMEAEELLRQESSLNGMASTVYTVDILAAQADVLVAMAHSGDDTSVLYQAWAHYRRAVSATEGRARERFQACLRWVASAAEQGHASEAFKAYAFAIEILPQVAFLGEDIVGRIEALRQISGLASSSVAAALTSGNITSAIEFLERSRGILWQQSSPSQLPLDDLSTELRQKFTSINRALASADRLQWGARRRKAEEQGAVIAEIRAIPNFERFMLPPLMQDIHNVLSVGGGYSAVVVPSPSFSDVIILGGSKGPSHLRLAGLRLDYTEALIRALAMEGTSTRTMGVDRKIGMNVSTPNDAVEGVLSDLWYYLVHPILKELRSQVSDRTITHFTCTHDTQQVLTPESPKRLWWCPIGPLSKLPLHAAGIYSEGKAEDHLGHYLISSYVPTLTAFHKLLSEATGATELCRGASRASSPRMLLVAQPQAGSLPPLPYAKVEVELVRHLVPRIA